MHECMRGEQTDMIGGLHMVKFDTPYRCSEFSILDI